MKTALALRADLDFDRGAYDIDPELFHIEDGPVAQDHLLLLVTLDRAAHFALGDVQHLRELRGSERGVLLQDFQKWVHGIISPPEYKELAKFGMPNIWVQGEVRR